MNAFITILSIGALSLPLRAGTDASTTLLPTKVSAQVEANPTAKLEATRLPRRDTRTPLVCTAADAAPKLADRVSEGSCRSHTGEHQVDARGDKEKWPARTIDIQAFSGR